ncbi:MAG: flagellar hook-basal body protein [Candidatus Eisenbacteria sp.]|nr:flagellar hook-basal body protein [Candidatus Eisenbacteria bacterium]
MVKGILTSAGAMRPALLAQDILANNLANANTTGFRADRMAFQLINSQPPGAGSIEAATSGPVLTTRLDNGPGAYQVTDRPLDLALQGEGFFVVNTPEGDRYTRSGHFMLGDDGTLITPQGHAVLSDGGPLTLPGNTDVQITSSGQIRAQGRRIGRLQVVTFEEEPTFTHAGGGLLATEAEPMPADGSRVLQGVLEGPNVESVQAMVEMITLLRYFEMNQKALQIQDESLGNLLAWVRA